MVTGRKIGTEKRKMEVEMGKEGSGISHLTALIGVKGDVRWVIAVKHKLHAGGSSVIRFTRC